MAAAKTGIASSAISSVSRSAARAVASALAPILLAGSLAVLPESAQAGSPPGAVRELRLESQSRSAAAQQARSRWRAPVVREGDLARLNERKANARDGKGHKEYEKDLGKKVFNGLMAFDEAEDVIWTVNRKTGKRHGRLYNAAGHVIFPSQLDRSIRAAQDVVARYYVKQQGRWNPNAAYQSLPGAEKNRLQGILDQGRAAEDLLDRMKRGEYQRGPSGWTFNPEGWALHKALMNPKVYRALMTLVHSGQINFDRHLDRDRSNDLENKVYRFSRDRRNQLNLKERRLLMGAVPPLHALVVDFLDHVGKDRRKLQAALIPMTELFSDGASVIFDEVRRKNGWPRVHEAPEILEEPPAPRRAPESVALHH